MAVFPLSHKRQAVQRKRRTPKATPTSAPTRTYHHRHVCTDTPAYSTPPATGRTTKAHSRGNGGVPPFPQPAGGAKKTAHTQSNPNGRTHPNVSPQARLYRHVCTGTPAWSPLLIPPAKQQDNRGTPHMKVVPLFPQPAGVAKKTAHVQINPNERTRPNASSQTRLHRHARINGTCAPRTNPNNQTSNHPVGF